MYLGSLFVIGGECGGDFGECASDFGDNGGGSNGDLGDFGGDSEGDLGKKCGGDGDLGE